MDATIANSRLPIVTLHHAGSCFGAASATRYNTVEIGEYGDEIGPNRPEHNAKQGDHHQHGNTQRLLVDLLQRNCRLFLRFSPFSPSLTICWRRASARRQAIRRGNARPRKTVWYSRFHSITAARFQSSDRPDAGWYRSSRWPSVPSARQAHRENGDGEKTQAVRLYYHASSRHIGHTSTAISSRLRKITNCPSTSSIRFSGDSSETTDQKFSGSSARLTRTICRRQWLVSCGNIKVAYRHTVFFQHLPAQTKHQPEQRQFYCCMPTAVR